MDKFSYSLELYKQGLFDLDDINLYKRKVKEAEKVENYYSKLLPNVEYVRPYILMSYKFDKTITYKDRVRFVRGLIYASDYVDFADAFNIPKDIEYFKEIGLTNLDLAKQSLWGFTAYIEEENTDEILSGENTDIDENEDEEEIDIKPTDDNIFEIQKENIDKLIKLIDEAIDEEYEEENTDGNEEDYNIESYISIEEKISRFKKNSNIYIENLLNDKLKHEIIKQEDIKMVKRAMKLWFKRIFYIMEKLIELDNKEYTYKDENIVRFL